MRRKTILENDSDATPTGEAWEGLDSVASGSQVSDSCFISVEAEPGLSKEHKVNCIVINVAGDLISFFRCANSAGIKQCHMQSGNRGMSRNQEGNAHDILLPEDGCYLPHHLGEDIR